MVLKRKFRQKSMTAAGACKGQSPCFHIETFPLLALRKNADEQANIDVMNLHR
jgi:hypothetical protein